VRQSADPAKEKRVGRLGPSRHGFYVPGELLDSSRAMLAPRDTNAGGRFRSGRRVAADTALQPAIPFELAHGAADNDGGANQDQVFYDVLPFDG
jgi:hypothetical protein